MWRSARLISRSNYVSDNRGSSVGCRGKNPSSLDTGHSSLESLTLWNHLSESRDGNRRPFESTIRTLGQRRTRHELKWQRATRSYLSGYRRVRSHTGALFARVKLILP